MSYTRDYTATQADWLKVAENVNNAFLQLQDAGPVKVQVAQAKPAVGDFSGAELDARGLMDWAIDGMEAGDAVYIRSRHGEDNLVTVIAPGVAPV